ncbi:MAG: hypothetical protein ACRD25_02505 [Terracidiphilus sp.]
MQLLADFREYVILACVSTAIAAACLFSVLSGSGFYQSHSQSWIDLTVCILMGAYVFVLLRKTSNKLERTGIFIFLAWTAEAIPKYLAEAGVSHSIIPHEKYVSAAFACLVAVLADIRACQVFRAQSHLPESAS